MKRFSVRVARAFLPAKVRVVRAFLPACPEHPVRSTPGWQLLSPQTGYNRKVMSPDQPLLEVLLECWDRNNTILVNLLRALPPGGLETRAMEGTPSVAQLFTHIHYVRLVFLSEDAPEFAEKVPEDEWALEGDPARIAQLLNQSARAVRDAVKAKVKAGGDMNLHYDHPILFLQHMIWHEGYHHGQIKLALKLAGRPITDERVGPVTWRVWMNKTQRSLHPNHR